MYNSFDLESEEDSFDSFFLEITNMAEIEDQKTAIIVPKRIAQLLLAYKTLKKVTNGTNAKVTYTLHEPYKSMGSISVIGNNLEVINIELFKKAVELSSNIEVYSRTDGSFQMNFTFHGLTKPINLKMEESK